MSSAEASIEFLLERLRWPIRLVRWRAAQEIAALFASNKHRRLAHLVYLNWLKTRKLESEVISGLSVLQCTDEGALPDFSALCAVITRPSVLADIVLQAVYGFNSKRGGWRDAHSGRPPASFEPASYFLKHRDVHVAPILGSTLGDLFEKYGVDLPRQWAYEWQCIMDSEGASYSGYPYFFMDEYRDRGVYGQFSQRQCDIYRSAFLRVLAYAVSTGMSVEFASEVSTETLAVSSDFAKTRSVERPSWLTDLPDTFFNADADHYEATRNIVEETRKSTGRMLICLNTPASIDKEKFGYIKISAVLATEDFALSIAKEAYYGGASPWLIGVDTSLNKVLPKENIEERLQPGATGSYLPLSLNIHPFPHGFWHNDYLQIGMAFPASYCFNEITKAQCSEVGIDFESGGIVRGHWSVWHDHWSPLYPKDGHTRSAMLTTVDSNLCEQLSNDLRMRLGWIVEKRLWRSERDYSELKEICDVFFIFNDELLRRNAVGENG